MPQSFDTDVDTHPDVHLPLVARERAYTPSTCIGGNYQPFIDAYGQRSRQARQRTELAGARWLRVAYGELPSQGMDLCLPPPSLRPQPALAGSAGVGLLVFIHGGYWQELSSQDSLFAAEHCVAQGLAFCALDYTLAPQARVGDMVQECRRALQTLAQGAAAWGIDPHRIVVAGSSAGAQLAAMTCLPQWAAGAARGFDPRAALLISGVFDLQPLVGTTINAALGLDAEEARALSPARHRLQGFPVTRVVWGDNETAAFKSQSQDFAQKLHAAGTACTRAEIQGRNHFDIVLDLADPATSLGRMTLDLFAHPDPP